MAGGRLQRATGGRQAPGKKNITESNIKKKQNYIWFAPENTVLYIASRVLLSRDPWRSRVTRGDPWKAFLHGQGRAWGSLESSLTMSSSLALL